MGPEVIDDVYLSSIVYVSRGRLIILLAVTAD